MEKRFQKRALCADLVTIELMCKRGWKQIVPAVLEDISSRGLCLQVETAMPVNGQVQVIHATDWSAKGRVTYCVYREIGYFIGVEFEENTNWAASAFQPQHLFAPEDLLAEPSVEARVVVH